MKIEVDNVGSTKGKLILSKDAYMALLCSKAAEFINKYESPVEKLMKEISEAEGQLNELREEALTYSKTSDVILKHHENFLHRNGTIPRVAFRTVGVNVNIISKEERTSTPSAESKQNATKPSVKVSPSATQSPIGSQLTPTRQIKTEPGASQVLLVTSSPGKQAGAKRSSVDLVDLTAEDEKSQARQSKTSPGEKQGSRLYGALTREPINSKSQPVLLQEGANLAQKFTALPVGGTSLQQVIQLSPSQISNLSGSSAIPQSLAGAPKATPTGIQAGQRITYFLPSNTPLNFLPQGTTQAARPASAPSNVTAATRMSFGSSGLISANKGVPPPNSAIIVASRLPGHVLSSQSISEPRVVLPMPTSSFKHPAPLPEQPKYNTQPRSPLLEPPPKPTLKISKPNAGIVLSWNLPLTRNHAQIRIYQLYGYEETSGPADTSMWKKVGEVKALPLPMACTLTQFADGRRYHFAIRAMDIHVRIGPFSDIASIYLKPGSSTNAFNSFVLDSPDVDPSLLQLLFSVKSGKVRRPPNAFMLFSREYRKKVSEQNPLKENKAISTLLGRQWQQLPMEEKQKYYKMAEQLDILHKQQYPGYVYSPKEARLRKQERFKRSRRKFDE